MTTQLTDDSQGFTLIEISIVLVLLTLIIAAITAASSLVEAARLRGVVSDFQNIKNQVNTFYSKLGTLPGDFSDAGALWGSDCANGTGTDTCSGNGDGLTLDSDIGATTSESLRAWQHLTRAQVAIYNNLTGLPCAGAQNCVTVGENVPASKWPDAGYYLYSGSDDNIRLAAILGKETSNDWNNSAAMDPVQAHNIDDKMDDGNPLAGQIRGSSIPGATAGDATTCVNSGIEAYRVANRGIVSCNPAFILISR